jgi:uncharacterized protein
MEIKMNSRNFDSLSEVVLECGGESGLYHSKRLIKIIDEIAEKRSFNKDIIAFCAYTHDLGGYPKYMKENVDHAVRSREVVGPFIEQFNFSHEEKEIILETILNHHNPISLKSIEAVLLRDADAIDFLGFVGIARDINRAPKDIKKGIKSIQTHREKLPDILTLDSSKKMAEERIKEMDIFLNRFFSESYKYF